MQFLHAQQGAAFLHYSPSRRIQAQCALSFLPGQPFLSHSVLYSRAKRATAFFVFCRPGKSPRRASGDPHIYFTCKSERVSFDGSAVSLL